MKILLTHGSSDSRHAESADSLASAVGKKLGEPVQVATLGESLPKGVRVMPLFLTEGKHLLEDVPAMLAASGAQLVEGPASYPETMAKLLADRAAEERGRCRAVMFVLYRLLGATALAGVLYDQSKRFSLPAIAALYGECSFADVLALWRREGVMEAMVQPALLFPGSSLDELKQKAAGSGMQVRVGEPLATLPGFVDWVAGRFLEAA